MLRIYSSLSSGYIWIYYWSRRTVVFGGVLVASVEVVHYCTLLILRTAAGRSTSLAIVTYLVEFMTKYELNVFMNTNTLKCRREWTNLWGN